MFVVVWWHGIVVFALREPKIKGVWILLEPFKAQWLLYVPLDINFKKSCVLRTGYIYVFIWFSEQATIVSRYEIK
jgi:hypothetical protein